MSSISSAELSELSKEFHTLRNLHGDSEGDALVKEVDSPNGRKHQIMKILGSVLGKPGTAAADLYRYLGAPDQLVHKLGEEATVAFMPGPVIGNASSGDSQNYFFVYFLREKKDYLFFKVDSQEEKVIEQGWNYASEEN